MSAGSRITRLRLRSSLPQRVTTHKLLCRPCAQILPRRVYICPVKRILVWCQRMVPLLARMVFGLIFFLEGSQKLFGWWSGSPTGSGHPEPFLQWPYWWAGVVEIIVGFMLMIGLHTRVAAVLGAGTMAYAYFFVHLPVHWEPMENGGAFAATFCWGLLLLAVSTETQLSVDNVIKDRKFSVRSKAGLFRSRCSLR